IVPAQQTIGELDAQKATQIADPHPLHGHILGLADDHHMLEALLEAIQGCAIEVILAHLYHGHTYTALSKIWCHLYTAKHRNTLYKGLISVEVWQQDTDRAIPQAECIAKGAHCPAHPGAAADQ